MSKNFINKDYPNLQELKTLRQKLPKNGTLKVVEKTGLAKDTVYKVLAEKFQNPIIIKACLSVIIEDAESKKEWAEDLMQRMQPDTSEII